MNTLPVPVASLDTFYFRQSWPVAVVVLLLLCAVALAVCYYAPLRSLPLWKRLLLGGLRAVLLVLLLLLLLEPVASQTKRVTVPSNILVLLDVSDSMNFADQRKRPEDLEEAACALGKLGFKERGLSGNARAEVAAVPRFQLARALVEHPDLKFFRAPGEKYRLRYFSFGERVEAAPDDPDGWRDWLGRLQAKAPGTRLGEALQQAVERFSGQPIAGVILLTDGASNEGVDPLEVVPSLQVPIFPVGLGLPSPDDVRVLTVNLPEAVFPKDRVPVRVQLQGSPAFAGREVTITLKVDGRDLERKIIALTGTSQFENLAFVPEQQSGSLKVEITLAPLPGEATEENNRVTRSVKIIDEKIKVLFVEGRPRWEFRYLRAVLERDHRMAVKFLMTEGDTDLATASPQYLARFPEDEAATFQHDLVILGDVPADYFTPGQLAWMEKLVREKGGSFLMLAGQQHAPTSYPDTPVAKLLPVKLAIAGREIVEPGVHPMVTAAGKESAITTLESTEADNTLAWSFVRPLHTLPRLAGARPGATVLATLSDRADDAEPYPLVAWQRYGSGKVMFVGTDKLWRLRYQRGDEYHARFWSQAIQFLTLSRLLGENKRVRLETDRKVFRTGERVLLQASVLDSEYHPVKAESYHVLLEQVPPQGEPRAVTLRAVPGMEGLFQSQVLVDRPGGFQVRPLPQDESVANRAEFQVEAVSKEKLEPGLQKQVLEKLAELSGGKYQKVRDLPSLPEHFPDRSRQVTLPPQETELWNNWWVLVLILGLAGSEWFIRRQSDVA